MSTIRKEIELSLRQLHRCLCKPITFSKSIEKLDGKSKIKLLLRLIFYSVIISILINLLLGAMISLLEYSFDLRGLLLGVAIESAMSAALGGTMGLAGATIGNISWGKEERLAWRSACGIAGGIAGGFVGGIVGGFIGGMTWVTEIDMLWIKEIGIASDIGMGFALGFAVNISGRLRFAVQAGILGILLIIILGIQMGLEKGIVTGIVWSITGSIGFLVSYSRVFYILPHFIQYIRIKIFRHKPFSLFRNSPVYWDEVIISPLPFLSEFLVILVNENRNEGLKEIDFVSSQRPTQRKAAASALLDITIQDLGKFNSIQEIADVSKNISFLSAFEGSLSENLSSFRRNIENISQDAKSYLNSTSNYNKLRNLNALRADIDKFKKVLIVSGVAGYKFHSVAEKWSQIIDEENNKLIELEKETFEPIPNPYIFGNPVRAEDKSRLFIGRIDIIREIEANLSNISQKPALFLYGRRRVGKSSVLLNLPRFLGKQYVPVYIDCQDAGARESISSFCYSLSKSIANSLKDRSFSLESPSLESYQKNPITTLRDWFDRIESPLQKENKLILITLDEYERLEESILSGTLTIEILNMLRNIIQHRKYFIVLITGSKELKELKLNWSDYLISAKMIKLGHLSKDDARILITNPIDDFNLNYEGGEKGKVVNKIIDVTNCQPYLVQALCYELVNYLNTQHRREARNEDIDVSIEKLLISAESYFYYIWNSECSEIEKEVLKRLINNSKLDGYEKEINLLVKKEIIEKSNGSYKFKVELMKKWVEKNN